MKTVISFSGGIDSTYVMWKLLTTTDDEITAYFMDERYLVDEPRGGTPYMAPYAELAVDNLYNALSQIRSFSLVKINAYEFSADESKHVWFLRYIAPKLNDGTYDRVAFGLEAASEKQKTLVARTDNMPSTTTVLKREFNNVATRGSLYFYYSDADETKAHAFYNLPAEILEKTISCISPIPTENGNFETCGVCHKCKDNALIRSSLNSGVSVEETALDYLKNRTSSGARNRYISIGGIWADLS